MAGNAHAGRPPRRRTGLAPAFTHWHELDAPSKTALCGAIGIAICAVINFPDFGWIEASQMLMALCVIRVIARQVEPRPLPLPFHDGTLIVASAIWTAVITTANIFDGSDTGTVLITFTATATIALAGTRVRSRDEPYWFE